MGREAATSDKALRAKLVRAARNREKLRDRRRFKVGNVASGSYSVLAEPDAQGTMFPSCVAEPMPGVPVLKDGAMNAKIGGDVLVGDLRGAKIFTLTLEERATCPRSCAHWRGCYGNAMPHPHRWQAGAALEERLAAEVGAACSAHGLVLIRLHILGDFYSTEYVALWLGLCALHPNLTVFGFTAWPESSPIGRLIADVRNAFPRRFMIRHSGRTGTWGSFDITDPLPPKTIGDAIVCPEQRESNLRDSTRHCGNCAACWSTDRPIVFIRH